MPRKRVPTPEGVVVRLTLNLRRDLPAEARLIEAYDAHPRPQEWLRQVALAGLVTLEQGVPAPVSLAAPVSPATPYRAPERDPEPTIADGAPPSSEPIQGTGNSLADELLSLGG